MIGSGELRCRPPHCRWSDRAEGNSDTTAANGAQLPRSIWLTLRSIQSCEHSEAVSVRQLEIERRNEPAVVRAPPQRQPVRVVGCTGRRRERVDDLEVRHLVCHGISTHTPYLARRY